MIDLQLYGQGVMDFSNATVTWDTDKLRHCDMKNAIVIELENNPYDPIYIKISERVVKAIKELAPPERAVNKAMPIHNGKYSARK
jgi:hypothetical protein